MQLFTKKVTPIGQGAGSAPSKSKREPGIDAENNTQSRMKSKLGGNTVSGNKFVDATKQSAEHDLEVAVGYDGLPEVLQTAALLFANNEMVMATDVLLYALENEPETCTMGCWLALMDLYVKQNQRAQFDELALRYVVKFERSAPAWDELNGRVPQKVQLEHQTAALSFPPECLGKNLGIIDQLNALVHKKIDANVVTTINIDQLVHIDAETGLLICKLLQQLRRKGFNLDWQGLSNGLKIVRRPLNVRARKHNELWLLAMEFLQWQNNQAEFENLAVDYAVCFSMSPPSWEPLTKMQAGQSTNAVAAKPELELLPTDEHLLSWQGKLSGPADLQVAKLHELKQVKRVSINIKDVTTIDFVCAGDISNGLLKVMASGCLVDIVGASPIIQALLQLTGTPQSLFVKSKARA
ncbi:MAG: hypothetical protein RLZZ502_1164 [Pseudomonadota bacterium]|jgi:anti-anti-sigma regulatory factor